MSVESVIRHALWQDWELIVSLDDEARLLVAEQRGGLVWLSEHESARDLGPDTMLDLSWVALIEQHVVGFIHCDIDDRPQRGKVCSVERVYVHELARELGCGDALLSEVMEYAKVHGCSTIEGNALPGDRSTKNLYERAGIVARKIIVSRPLS